MKLGIIGTNFISDRLMEAAGLEVLRGGAYDGFAHWVEQAITRDIAIAKKPQ